MVAHNIVTWSVIIIIIIMTIYNCTAEKIVLESSFKRVD